MGQILVVRDPSIVQTEIIHALESEDQNNVGNNYVEMPETDINQTDVYGVLVPILTINNIAVAYKDLQRFELNLLGRTPEIYFKFHDRRKMFSSYVQPGNDNEVRVQILPPVDNTYKKIDLTFYVTDISMNGDVVEGKAIYKLMKFTQSNFEALGMKTTYDIFDYVSLQTGLGFASNATATEDSRFMECRYNSYKELITNEIEKSVSDITQVYDWWVDQNNYLTLCNIYDRMNTLDSDEDMMVWVTTNYDDPTKGNIKDVHEIPCVITNLPSMNTSDLGCTGMEIINNPVQTGTSKVVSAFYENKKDIIDNYIGDGDIKRDEKMRYEYAGEVYGDYDYKFAEQSRKFYLSKAKSEIVVIKMKQPMMGLMRGSQLKFVWYSNDTDKKYLNDKLKENADALSILTNEEIFLKYPELQWLEEFDRKEVNDVNPMLLDMQYSGQYTLLGQYIIWQQGWYCELHCVRPKSMKPEIFPVTDPATGEPIEKVNQ